MTTTATNSDRHSLYLPLAYCNVTITSCYDDANSPAGANAQLTTNCKHITLWKTVVPGSSKIYCIFDNCGYSADLTYSNTVQAEAQRIRLAAGKAETKT
jgi:hypothetical protein